jgi:hypothetical protein
MVLLEVKDSNSKASFTFSKELISRLEELLILYISSANAVPQYDDDIEADVNIVEESKIIIKT